MVLGRFIFGRSTVTYAVVRILHVLQMLEVLPNTRIHGRRIKKRQKY